MTDKRKAALEALEISVKFMDARGWSHEERPGVERVKATLAALAAEQGPEVEMLHRKLKVAEQCIYRFCNDSQIAEFQVLTDGLKIIPATQEGK